MSRVFPRNTRAIAGQVMLGFMLLSAMGVGGVWYYMTPKYTRVGYSPEQPIPYSHELHVAKLGLDCRHCHTAVTESAHATIPSTDVCWKCHGADKGNIKADSPLLTPLREAWASGRPIPWVRVHRVPNYAYFDHSAHVNAGVGCVSCHGRVDQMPVVRHDQPMSMSWCLDCHRDPAPNLRPLSEVTNLGWNPNEDARFRGQSAQAVGKMLQKQSGVAPPVHCSGCHR